MSGKDPVAVGTVVLRRVKEKALLVEHPQVITDGQMFPAHYRWVMRRAVHETSEIHGREQVAGQRGVLVLMRWFVEKEANNNLPHARRYS